MMSYALFFYEGKKPFDPTILTNQFNHIFFVIQKDETKEQTHYKLVVVNKSGVSGHTPFLPDPPIFRKGDDFRDFIYTKLINSERVTLNLCPEFRSKMIRTRKEFLISLINKYDHKKKDTE